jgi:uncharacterized protein YbjQ (UPF0145 family)
MVDLIIILSLTALGYFAGTWAEKRHYDSIQKREKELLHLPVVTSKKIPYPAERVRSVQLVEGSAVISIDYFKRLLARLRNIFGGTITSYESLLDRARREALLRMKEMAPESAIIVNVRIETSAIGKYSSKRNIGCLEALAYGTAINLDQE